MRRIFSSFFSLCSLLPLLSRCLKTVANGIMLPCRALCAARQTTEGNEIPPPPPHANRTSWRHERFRTVRVPSVMLRICFHMLYRRLSKFTRVCREQPSYRNDSFRSTHSKDSAFGEGELLAVSLLHCTVQCMVQVCTPKRPPKRAHSNKVLEPGRVAHWQGGNTFHAPRTSRPCIARTRDDKGTTERTLTLDAA